MLRWAEGVILEKHPTDNVRFVSLADLFDKFSLMSASGGKAVT